MNGINSILRKERETIANLIADMLIGHASLSEIERVVRYSVALMDAERVAELEGICAIKAVYLK